MTTLILPYRNILPRIDPTAFIAPGVVITGDVEIGAHANIWFNVVIRGDDAPVRIGAARQYPGRLRCSMSRFDGTERIPVHHRRGCRGRPHGAAARLPARARRLCRDAGHA